LPKPLGATETDMAMVRAVPPKSKPGLLRLVLSRTLRVLGLLLFLLLIALGFGTTGSDYTKLCHFTESVDQWQHNTEFRQVAMQYVTRGSDAMRSRPMGFSAASWIIAIRSLPRMPKEFAVNETSRAHYQNFAKGPLSAYLHLCTEVELFGKDASGTPDFNNGHLPEIEGWFGKSAGTNDADLHAYLEKQKWDFPVVKDDGAVESLRAMLQDVDISRRLKVRAMHINDALRPHIQRLAAELNLPADPEAMTPAQQYAIFDRLDGYVRRNDPELWRTKQVSDFIGGVWGQVFSPPYTILLTPFLRASEAAKWLVLLTLVVAVIGQRRRLRRTSGTMAGADGRPATATPTSAGVAVTTAPAGLPL
jgi:hypothetical protein